MAIDLELLDLPDPGDLPEDLDLDNLDDQDQQDWVSLFLENNSLDDCDSASLGDFLPDVPLPEEITGSPSSGITDRCSEETRIKDEEAAGSGSEQSGSDGHKPASSGESNTGRPIKRLGKRKVDYIEPDQHHSSEEKCGGGDGGDEEETKRKARLMRNRESAQLSRQRKKAYVDDLEERIRTLNATVAELNNTVSLISTENVNLRNQLAYYYHARNGSGGGAAKAGTYVPPPPPMGLPMYQYPGGYVLRPGSAAPPVPIPRLKTQASVMKSSKSVKRAKVSKEETAKKATGVGSSTGKTKKLASVAALGFLCIMALVFPFDLGLPVSNPGGEIQRYVPMDHPARIGGRVLMGLEESNESSRLSWSPDDTKLGRNCDRQDHSGAVIDGSIFPANVSTYGNATHRFPASLLFPRDNQVVKVDGDLIIQAVMAGDGAGSSNPGGSHAAPALFRNLALQALPSGSEADGDDPRRKILNDLAGTPFSTGVCNEVFQFETTPEPRPAEESTRSSSKRSGSYRRNLSAVPLPPGPSSSSSPGKNSNSNSTENLRQRQRPTSMVVSIFNPKQAGSKDLARIFVVVLVDSVKYVTYSCLLPPQPRLVTG